MNTSDARRLQVYVLVAVHSVATGVIRLHQATASLNNHRRSSLLEPAPVKRDRDMRAITILVIWKIECQHTPRVGCKFLHAQFFVCIDYDLE